MADLLSHQLFARIGSQTDRTTVAAAFKDLAVSVGGLQATGDRARIQVATEHNARGNKYSLAGQRNAEKKTIQTPLFPQQMATFFDWIFTRTGGQLSYKTIEQYYTGSLTGSGTGKQLRGCIGDDFSLSIARSGGISELSASYGFYVNADYELTAAAPSYTAPSDIVGPYDSGQVFVDLVEHNGTPIWSGNHAQLLSVDLQFSNNTFIDGYNANTIEALNRSWTKQRPGVETLTVNATIVVDDLKYLDYLRSAAVQQFGLRVMGWHTGTTYSDTLSSATLVTGANTDLQAADVTGLADGDVVLASNPDESKINVGVVSNVDAGADQFDLASGEVDIGVTSEDLTVRNGAWMIKVPRLDIDTVGNPTDNNGAIAVQVGMSAQLNSSETSILSHKAYDDDSA